MKRSSGLLQTTWRKDGYPVASASVYPSEKYTMEQTFQELIDEWKQRVNDQQKANYALAVKYNKYHYGLGLSVIVFTAFAGAALIITAEESWLKNTLGIVGIIAAVFSFVQTVYSQGRRAENHYLQYRSWFKSDETSRSWRDLFQIINLKGNAPFVRSRNEFQRLRKTHQQKV
jgi:hypothetical protein